MSHVFSDSQDKQIVREQWNTPLLRHLHERYGYSYRYFGLPGPDIIDIKLWRDMIEEVVAFEIPAEGEKPERTYINSLRKNLSLIGISNTTYYGSFEEVVLLKRDYDGQEYVQNNVITLYNLDFCGEIGSKITSRSGARLYRLEAIRHIIRDQIELHNRYGGPPCFLILLTVRNQMHARLLRERLEDCRPLWPEYVDVCQAVRPVEDEDQPLIGTHAWALKTVIYSMFRQTLTGNNISALFFPIVKYRGADVKISSKKTIPSPMLHLMVFCKFQSPYQVAGVSLPTNPLLTRSLSVNDHILCQSAEPGEEIDVTLCPVEYYEALTTGL